MPRPRTLVLPWPQLRTYSTRRSLDLPALQRELFRRVAQPVAVLTAHVPTSSSTRPQTAQADNEHNHGATLSSLTSISLWPPLVCFSLRLPSRLASHICPLPSPRQDPRPPFKLHLLSPRQENLARLFARQAALPAPAAPSPDTDWSVEPSFDPDAFRSIEHDSLGTLSCRVVKTVNLWDVERSDVGNDSAVAKDPPAPDGGAMRSQLIIARVEDVRLGGDVESSQGSLLWMEQAYTAAHRRQRDR
ncbi:hypothetical protein JCM10212_004433 [Sporobolomyces blumeae]